MSNDSLYPSSEEQNKDEKNPLVSATFDDHRVEVSLEDDGASLDTKSDIDSVAVESGNGREAGEAISSEELSNEALPIEEPLEGSVSEAKPEALSILQPAKKIEKKPSFFQRLFGKKQKVSGSEMQVVEEFTQGQVATTSSQDAGVQMQPPIEPAITIDEIRALVKSQIEATQADLSRLVQLELTRQERDKVNSVFESTKDV